MSLASILEYWFPNEKYQSFWFDGSPDEYIKNTYLELLAEEETGKHDYLQDNHHIVARIVLLDQFTRNI
jgi:uncharacterized protein (DUF924 family)